MNGRNSQQSQITEPENLRIGKGVIKEKEKTVNSNYF